MATFLERYKAGDHVAVWDDLVALGPGVRHELYLADAVAVAAETMRRARRNVEVLIPRLTEMGYCFVAPVLDQAPDIDASMAQMLQRAQQIQGGGPEIQKYLEDAAKRVKESMGPLREKVAARKAETAAKAAASLKKPPLENPDVFDPPNATTAKALRRLEKEAGGPLPLSLQAWYEQVGGVSLLGSHAVLNPPGDNTPDPLVIASLTELFSMLDSGVFEDANGTELWLAPDDFHKANISGGSPYSMTVPNPCADANFENEWQETTFVNYLRKAFEWGGFPGWERSQNPPDDLIDTLTEGLLPL